MKIYILGSTGFLGGKTAEYMKNQGHEVITDRVDLTDLIGLKKKFDEVKPDAVINFAGVRAYPTIDWCEDNKEATVAVNVGGALNFALASITAGAYPIMICSGCVYTGDTSRKFTEDDEPNFFGSFYSRMRHAMQISLKELPVLQVRIRMPISMHPHPRNFITKIASYQKVINIPNSMTLIEDMLPALEILMEKKPFGILNLTNDGYVQHKDVLAAYKEIVDPNHTYIPITLEELQGKGGITTSERSNCVLDTTKCKSLGINMPEMNYERLLEIMKVYKQGMEAGK